MTGRISCHDPSDTLGGLHNCEVTISLPGEGEYMSSFSPTCCRMQNLCNFGILAPLYCTCEIAVTYSKSNEPHNFSMSEKVIFRLDLPNQLSWVYEINVKKSRAVPWNFNATCSVIIRERDFKFNEKLHACQNRNSSPWTTPFELLNPE